MATVAAPARKRELAPHWRDTLRDSVRRLAIRTSGATKDAIDASSSTTSTDWVLPAILTGWSTSGGTGS